MDTKMTVREATLQVIDQSAGEFVILKENFKRASDAFDVADDQTGLQIIAAEIWPRVKGLAEFCNSLYETHIQTLGMEHGRSMYEYNLRLKDLLAKLDRETGAENFTEVGDLLRFDFSDLVGELEPFFLTLRQCFVDSKIAGLDATF